MYIASYCSVALHPRGVRVCSGSPDNFLPEQESTILREHRGFREAAVTTTYQLEALSFVISSSKTCRETGSVIVLEGSGWRRAANRDSL